jgi:hypothetical protein
MPQATRGALRRGGLASCAMAMGLPPALAVLQQDLSAFLLVLIGLVLVVSVVALVGCVVVGKSRRWCLLMLGVIAVFVATSAVVLPHANAIRATARWLFWSNAYKAEVLASPAPASGQLRHIEWDGWGMFGMDTIVYLVFDPTDQLSAQAARAGKLSGIPCDVLQTNRLESRWYSIAFDTGEDWNSCKT